MAAAALGDRSRRRRAALSDLSDNLQPMSRMTATEAARSFSELLNRVAAGEEIEVIRNGAEVAVISPPKPQLMSAARFRELIASAPLPDESFVDEVRASRASVGPPQDAWPS
jgi:prevent-host-death family protein